MLRRSPAVRTALRSPLLRVASARIATFPITMVCGLLWLRLVIGSVSTADYALVAVVVGLQFLLSFLDFGTTAHILDESGRYAVDRDVRGLGAAVGRAVRTIVTGNAVLFVVAAALAVTGAWGGILGFPSRSGDAAWAVLLTLGLNLVARPLSLANSLVAGLGRPTVAQWSQAAASVVSLGGAALCIGASLPLPFLVATPILGQLAAYLVPLTVSLRSAPGLLRASRAAALHGTGHPGAMRKLAGPMLLIQVMGPLNDQLDRLVLSHRSTVEAVATYSLAAQLYASAATVITSLLPTLWVQFAELRVSRGEAAVAARALRWVRLGAGPVLALGAAFAGALWLLGPAVSAGEIELSWVLCALLAVTLPAYVLRSILGVALSDAAGLRTQAAIIAVTTSVNLALTFALAGPLGAVGPVAASLTAVLLELAAFTAVTVRRLRVPVGTGEGEH